MPEQAIYEVRTSAVKLSGPEPASLAISGFRKNAILPKRIKAIPSVQSPMQKNFPSRRGQITSDSAAVSAHRRGAYRDRHGRRARDAVDAGSAQLTSARFADGEVVWYQRRRFEVPAVVAASLYQELQIESGPGISNLLLPFAFRSSLTKVLQR